MISDADIAQIERKQLVRQFERTSALEDREELETALEKARLLANDDECLQRALKWVEALTLVGCHSTYAVQAFAGWLYRNSAKGSDRAP